MAVTKTSNAYDYSVALGGVGFSSGVHTWEVKVDCVQRMMLGVQTPHPIWGFKPYTLYGGLHPKRHTVHPKRYTLHPAPYTLNPKPET